MEQVRINGDNKPAVTALQFLSISYHGAPPDRVICDVPFHLLKQMIQFINIMDTDEDGLIWITEPALHRGSIQDTE